jgi:hypothetical protein
LIQSICIFKELYLFFTLLLTGLPLPGATNTLRMQKLSATQMKAVLGGGDAPPIPGETGAGNKGDTQQGNRSTCTALIEYRHSNSTAFTRVAVCDAPGTATRDGGTVLSCNC